MYNEQLLTIITHDSIFIVQIKIFRVMEKAKSNKIQSIYGYSVCIVAVITFLITITSVVFALFDLTDPLASYRTYTKDSPSLASFENYKTDIIISLDPSHGLVLDDETLKSMYESAREDAISKVVHQSYRSILVNSLLVIISLILFLTHWIWMRKLNKKE